MGLVARKVLITGGNAKLPNFRDRFEEELRQYVPDIFPIEVSTA